jgi:hypothetical protein
MIQKGKWQLKKEEDIVAWLNQLPNIHEKKPNK